MRAVVITRPGGPDVLELANVGPPRPAADQILVRVRAAGVNRADLLQREGRYPPPPGVPAEIPGLEYAGEVEQVGERAGAWRAGDRVMGLVGGGGYAELMVADAAQALRLPAGWSFEQGAAVPEAFLTAFDALMLQGGLAPSQRVLIHAVGSGVGVAALLLVKHLGASAAGTSRTPGKLARAVALGLDHPVHLTDAFDPGPEFTNWADIVLELVGGAYLPGSLRAIAPRGRLLLVGLTGGRTATLDLGLLLGKRVTLIGTVLRSRSASEKMRLVEAFRSAVMPLFERGLAPVVDRVFPFEQVRAAHRYVQENRNFGSVVLGWT